MCASSVKFVFSCTVEFDPWSDTNHTIHPKEAIHFAISLVAVSRSPLGPGQSHTYPVRLSLMISTYCKSSISDIPMKRKSACTTSLGCAWCRAIAKGLGIRLPLQQIIQWIKDWTNSSTSILTLSRSMVSSTLVWLLHFPCVPLVHNGHLYELLISFPLDLLESILFDTFVRCCQNPLWFFETLDSLPGT